MPERGADDDERQQLRGRLGDRDDGLVDGVEKDVLEEEVVDGVAGQAQLREEGDGHALVVAGPDLDEHPFGVGRGVRQRDGQGARGDPGEPLGVDVPEVHAPSLWAGIIG